MYKYPMQGVYRVNLQRLWRDRAGNVLVLAAACMPLLIGAAGLAVDTANWTYWKRQLQREADSAALAGAYAKAQGKDAIAAATNDLTRTNVITLSTPADIKSAPTTGSFAGNPLAVRVALSTQRRLPFSGAFMSSAPVISAHATAAILVTGQYCALALGSGSVTGITMSGSAAVNFGCGMATNSTSKTKAVVASGSSSITASPIAAVGGLSASSNYTGTTQLLPYTLPQQDPYASVPTPTTPSSCSPQTNVQPKETQAFDASANKGNCYKGLNIKGTATFKPGIYYIDGGTFSVGSGANVSIDTSGVATGGETGVTFILTSSTAATNPSSIATLDINGGATINLAATTLTTSPYEGLLFYQDRRALDSGTNNVNGNASSVFYGGFYFPSQELDFSGTSGMTTKCIQLVALRLTFIGDTAVNNTCDKPGGGGGHSFQATVVRLVE